MLREFELKRSDCVLTVLSLTLKIDIVLKPWCPPNDDGVCCLQNTTGRLVALKT